MANYLHLACAVLFPIVCGSWSSSMVMAGVVKRPGGKAWYQLIKKPHWTPRNALFAPIWVVLYSSMGCASYMVYSGCDDIDKSKLPLALYGGQLILNFMWTPIFFGLHSVKLAFFEMLLLDITTVACTYSFYQISTFAALLMSPYIAWLVFVSSLNFAIWRMNLDSKGNELTYETNGAIQ